MRVGRAVAVCFSREGGKINYLARCWNTRGSVERKVGVAIGERANLTGQQNGPRSMGDCVSGVDVKYAPVFWGVSGMGCDLDLFWKELGLRWFRRKFRSRVD